MSKYNLIIDNARNDFDLFWQILDIKKERPEVFYDEMEKLSVYYMFKYSIWSKTPTDRGCIPFENIEADLNKLQDASCGIFFELENTELEKECFYDRFSNIVMDTARGKDVYAVVYSSSFAEFIKERYPFIKLVLSEIRRADKLEKPFEMRVIDYNAYKNGFSGSREEIVLAVNSFCSNSYKCTRIISDNKLNYSIERPNNCPERIRTFTDMKKNALFVSLEEMRRINDEGVKNFFVKANSDDRYEILETYLYYLIKPEFLDEIRLRLIKACFMK